MKYEFSDTRKVIIFQADINAVLYKIITPATIHAKCDDQNVIMLYWMSKAYSSICICENEIYIVCVCTKYDIDIWYDMTYVQVFSCGAYEWQNNTTDWRPLATSIPLFSGTKYDICICEYQPLDPSLNLTRTT